MEDLQSQLDREALIEVFQEDWRFKLRVQSVCTELEEHLQEDLHCCCPEKNISAKFCCCSLRSQPSTLFAWRKDVSKVTSSSSSFLCNLIVEVNKEEISKTVESASDKPEMKKTTLVTIGYSVRIFPVNENWSSDCEKCQKWTKALKRKLLEGHVLIHNNLRRQFGIPKFTYVSFGPICLDNVSYNDVSLKVFPSEKVSNERIV